MRHPSPMIPALAVLALAVGAAACGSDEPPKPTPSAPAARAADPARPAAAPSSAPDSLDQGLVLALASFGPRQPGASGLPKPEPASMEFLIRQDGEWKLVVLQDEASNVFHKAMTYETPTGESVILSAAGSTATLKLWHKKGGGLEDQSLWEKDFGGKFSRMRDVEVADLFSDGSNSMAVATHDQGVVATVRPGDGGYTVEEIDHDPNMFVHEIEIGDLDGDGTLEVYATPSEPNRLDGSPQTGSVVRYVPARGEGRVVVADLGDRHAKEILVDDVDGDGRDELYVSVEGHVDPASKALKHGVTVLRFDADTPPAEGHVVAEIKDRLSRFLTAGDVDGDGKKEMVAATFSAGLWLMRPGDDPRASWKLEAIDRDSGGFEHAALLTDLDGDGRDELYVASDKHGEVRRYVWKDGKPKREVILKRDDGRSIFTWNLMPVPVALVPSE